jgi:16S rRNA (uracil1498-N3)-methyltransferase
MLHSRIFQSEALNLEQILRLDPQASHRLIRVLRQKPGDHITLFNGDGYEYTAIITAIDKKGVKVTITARDFVDRESPLQIALAQGMVQGSKMDMILQKAVELGVYSFTPLITERTQGKTGTREVKRMQHFQSVIVSACEQCGRNHMPVLHEPISFTEWLQALPQAGIKIVLSPEAKDSELPPLNNVSPLTVLIGPEGGLTQREIEKTLQKQFVPLKLGPRILRAETATLVILSILQRTYGDLL